MPQSCRDAIFDIWKDWKDHGEKKGTNASLLKDRYLEYSVKDDKHKEARDLLHQAMREAIGKSMELYRLAYDNWYECISATKNEGIFKGDIFRTDGRMIIGLGGENVLETGLSLQHIFGAPFIPGSALKGLAAHYCDQICGLCDPNFKLGRKYHEAIFGTTEDSGHIIFHDAWIDPESLVDSLKPDVMTPHHGDYY
jgi:CRISPR-associated protein Cmr6